MRRLVYVPILHTELDLGSLAGRVRDAYVARHGEEKWERYVRAIEDMWKGISERVLALRLDYRQVKVYQDGLPVCGTEEVIVRDLARKGSPNHVLVARLIDAGATLVGTEDPGLLLREYEAAKGGVVTSGQSLGDPGERLADRDRFVARRIDQTLHHGETGVLFMGLAHEVPKRLPRDVHVEFVIHRLPFHSLDAATGGAGERKARRREDDERDGNR